jgi:hypothetical protein
MNTRLFFAVAAACVSTLTAFSADELKSLMPAFGPDGKEFTATGKDDHKLKGWLPKDWVDNSDWAAVNATYTKLSDPPKEGITAIRIAVEKVDEGQLQFTSWTKPKFKKDVKYVIEGWIRSKENTGITVGARQPGEPYEFYAEQALETGPEWKRFTFEFSLTEDREAFVMFYKQDTGTVDLGGIVVRERK